MKIRTLRRPCREAVKKPQPLERLTDTVFNEWGIDAVLENGESVRVVFHDNAQHSSYGAKHDGLSESRMSAIMGTVDIRSKDLMKLKIEPNLGMRLRLADYWFTVINEPRKDILMDYWQLDVMETD